MCEGRRCKRSYAKLSGKRTKTNIYEIYAFCFFGELRCYAARLLFVYYNFAISEEMEIKMQKIIDWIASVNGVINNAVWGLPGLILLIGTGVLLTCGTKFFQVTKVGHWWKTTIASIFKKDSKALKNTDKKTISQFQALCAALAATVGTGNIAGVAAAIVVGGPGAVFWMWVAQRAEFFVYADNPVLRLYQRLIKCYGGRQVGYLTRSSYFDGKYHDAIIFEILKEEFKA